MCGISGIFTKEKINGRAISQSLKSIQHRGPDNSLCGIYKNQKFQFLSNEISDNETKSYYINSENEQSDNWIGFNRLSIIDLSNNGMQPFYDESSQTAFMLNGEIYNFSELRDNELRNESFISNSDTEVAFKLYLKFGDEFIHKLRGMFTIVVVEYISGKVKIWRDRFGVKPLYYIINEHQFIFSSEMKGLFATELIQKEIETKHLAHIYYLNSNFAPNTLYQNIFCLEAATKLEVDFNSFQFKKVKYWELKYEPQNQVIEREEFISDLNEVTRLSTVADVKQALMLSGGLDSGILSHFLSLNNAEIEAVTIYNKNDDRLNEFEFAKITAEKNNMKLSGFEVPDNVDLATLYEYATTEEEPSGSIEPAYFLAKKASEKNTKVLYNALGLDELFYGYKYFAQAIKFDSYKSFLSNKFKYLLKGSKHYRYDEMTKLGIHALPFITRSTMSWKSILELFGRNDWEHPVLELMKDVPPDFYKFPVEKQLSWLDFHFYISSYHTFRSDQPSMKHSVEMRFPFLDHLFVQKYFNQTYLNQNLSSNNNKPFLRKNAGSLLDERVLNMPKKGFSMPRESWVKSLPKTIPDLYSIKQLYNVDLVSWADTTTKKLFLFSTAQSLRNDR